MKYKLFLSLLIIFSLFIITGCSENNSNSNSDSNNNNNNNNVIDDDEGINNNCSELINIKIKTSDGFITNNNDFYLFGSYSDGTNCKKINNDVKVKKVIGNYLVDESNNIYQINKYGSPSIELLENSVDKYAEYFKNKDDIIKIQTVEFTNNINSLNSDGIIYNYNLEKDFTNNTIFLVEKKVHISFEGEKILDYDPVNFDIDWIKTDKAYYIKVVKNNDCHKYTDIVCEYELIKHDELINNYNDIAYLEGQDGNYSYILKDGTIKALYLD